MERDPVRFVWGAAPTLNAILMVLALLAVPGLWMLLDLIRAAIDDGALGRPFLHGGTAPFLRFVIPLPGRMADGPLVLVPGLALSRTGIVQGLGAALLAAALGTGLLLVTSTLIRAEIGRRALGRVEERILDGMALAPTAATAGARRAARLASDSLFPIRSFLGRAIGTPALAGGLLLGCLLFLAFLDIRLAVVAALGLAALALATNARTALQARTEAADLAANNTLRRSLGELAEHLPAVAAHGTASSERHRILSEMAPIRRPGQMLGQTWAVAVGIAAALTFATVAGVLAFGAWLGLSGRLSPGEVAAGTAAAAFATGALERLLRWRSDREEAEPVFAEIARQLGSFNARRRERAAAGLPAEGLLAAEGVVVDGIFAGLDLSLALPSHVALVGAPDSGAQTFAGLLGAQAQARAGDLTLGDVSIAEAEPAERAQRLAFAGGETLLLANTLRANLLYGCSDADAPGIDARLMSALEVAGLDGFVYRRGLAGVIDTRREPDLATAIVDARANMRAELDRSGLASLVQPFNPERYNPHATIGENILFGVALGDTFREENLAPIPSRAAFSTERGYEAACGTRGRDREEHARDVLRPPERQRDRRPVLAAAGGRAGGVRGDPGAPGQLAARHLRDPRCGPADRARAALQREQAPPRLARAGARRGCSARPARLSRAKSRRASSRLSSSSVPTGSALQRPCWTTFSSVASPRTRRPRGRTCSVSSSACSRTSVSRRRSCGSGCRPGSTLPQAGSPRPGAPRSTSFAALCEIPTT
jgi:ABC-type multidrug transport system fused ATPase/permease subunit